MQPTSAIREHTILDLAQRYGFSPEAVAVMQRSVIAGNGRMAQFDHSDFGGSGQWMRGGMTMVGDMFDASLKERVAGLCSELVSSLEKHPDLSAAKSRPSEAAHLAGAASSGSSWWPAELGQANSAGAQNGMRYAYFANAHRLAIDDGGTVTLYDTLDHQISGVAQQQSSSSSLAFSSPEGAVDVATLPIVRSTDDDAPLLHAAPQSTSDVGSTRAPDSASASGSQASTPPSPSDTLSTIEKLAQLRSNGVLSNEEFATKKAELLRRI